MRCASVAVVAFIFAACGEGVLAPTTVGPFDPHPTCPSAEEATGDAMQALRDGVFDPLRPDIERILIDGKGLATILNLLFRVLPTLDEQTSRTLLQAMVNDETGASLQALTPHLINLLEYVHGTSPFIPGEHREPMRSARRMMTLCDPKASLGALHDLLALEVHVAPLGTPQRYTLAEPGQGDVSFLGALVDVMDRAGREPALSALMSRLRIGAGGEAPDDASGSIVVGRDAFIVLAKLLAQNVAAPDFDIVPMRGLLDDVLVPLVGDDEGARLLLDEALDLISLVVEKRASTFASMQAFMGCADRHDEQAAIPGMLFDYLSIEELSTEALIGDVAGAVRKEVSGQVRIAVVRGLDGLLAFPDATGDTIDVLAAFFEEPTVDRTIAVVLALDDTGVVDSLRDFIGVIIDCKELR